MLGRYFSIQSGNNSAIATGPQRSKAKWPSTLQRPYIAGQLVQLARDHARRRK